VERTGEIKHARDIAKRFETKELLKWFETDKFNIEELCRTIYWINTNYKQLIETWVKIIEIFSQIFIVCILFVDIQYCITFVDYSLMITSSSTSMLIRCIRIPCLMAHQNKTTKCSPVWCLCATILYCEYIQCHQKRPGWLTELQPLTDPSGFRAFAVPFKFQSQHNKLLQI